MRIVTGIFLVLASAMSAAPVRIGVVVDSKQRAFADAIRAGAVNAAHDLSTASQPIEVIWRQPEKPNDREAEAKLVDDMARSKVDALLVDAIDRQVLAGPVERAQRAGVRVIAINSALSPNVRTPTVSTDNREAGRQAARLIGGLLGGRGGVLLLRYQIHAAKTEQREEGFIEVMTREFPEVTLVASDYHAGATVESATRVSTILLQRYSGRIDAVYASSESGTLGMLAALRIAKLGGGKVKLVGSDEFGGVLAPALRSGDLQAYVAEDPRAMGQSAVHAALAPTPQSVATTLTIVTSAGIRPVVVPADRAAADLSPDVAAIPCPPVTPAPLRPGDFIVPDLGLAMVAVPAGTFELTAADIDGNGGEHRARTRVTLTQPYWLGKFEVTQREWERVMGTEPSDFRGECLPVDNVSWNDAIEFCRRLTARERAAGRLRAGYIYTLPTEAQWEYAARAGVPPVHDVSAIANVAWCATTSGAMPPGSRAWRMGTHPVGTKPANAWGFHDVGGNVSEWCLDWSGDIPAGPLVDPHGPATATYRVLRGGCWWSDVQNCAVDSRHRGPPARHHSGLGFRVALSTEGSP